VEGRFAEAFTHLALVNTAFVLRKGWGRVLPDVREAAQAEAAGGPEAAGDSRVPMA
jgi:hypothetical protein